MAQWVRNLKGGHTEPRFTDLAPAEKEFYGLAPNDQATRVSLVMLSDIPNIIALTEAGFSPEEARAHFTVTGLGTVRAEDWGSPSFTPNGRSKRWKLQKRALTDAYRRRFGEPSRHEIHVLRRQRGDVPLLPEDFEGTDHLLPGDRTNLALAHARARTRPVMSTCQDPDEIPRTAVGSRTCVRRRRPCIRQAARCRRCTAHRPEALLLRQSQQLAAKGVTCDRAARMQR
jgi:hypothetical protein